MVGILRPGESIDRKSARMYALCCTDLLRAIHRVNPGSSGTPLPKSGDPSALQSVVETGRPYVSNLFVGAISKQMGVAIYLPVIKDDAVTDVLGMVLPTSFVARVLHAQLLPERGFGVVIDREGMIISRTRGEEQFRGQPAAPGFVAAARSADAGSYETISVKAFRSVLPSPSPGCPGGRHRSAATRSRSMHRFGIPCGCSAEAAVSCCLLLRHAVSTTGGISSGR